MSMSKLSRNFKEVVTFILNEADLTNKQTGEYIETPKRDIPFSNGIQWWIRCYPAGRKEANMNTVSLYVYANTTVKAKYDFADFGCAITSRSNVFFEARRWGTSCLATHVALRPLFVEGRLSIICEVDFELSTPLSCWAPRIGQCCDHVDTDFEIIIGLDRLKVHKSFLSLISPVFHAMFTHDTAEAKSGTVEITDFDYSTVKAAIDFWYGRVDDLSADVIIGVLRMSDKYCVKVDQLEQVAMLKMSPQAFPAALQFADDHSKDSFFNGCCEFYKNRAQEVASTNDFSTLSPQLIARLLKRAFDLETDLDILRKAHSHGIEHVLEALEDPVIESLSLDMFCYTCKYAWDCSRDKMKKECGKFFNDNRVEITTLRSFVKLSAKVVHGVIKAGSDLL